MVVDLPREYSRDELVLIHQTDFSPQNPLMPEGFFKPESARSTIHFSLNGLVKTHSGGSYHDRRYAIVMPLTRLASRVEALSSEDTFMIGDLPLDDAVIMHPSEVEAYCRKEGYDWHELNAQGWRGWTGPQQEELARMLGFDDSPHKCHWTYKLENLFYRHLTDPSPDLAERIEGILAQHQMRLPHYILEKVRASLSRAL
ncbi:MAG: hypothetical protein KJ574_05125 [Nanoarchaeota archaeon]|nr:hypothetical protein [Nanoarchaeota archaeon]